MDGDWSPKGRVAGVSNSIKSGAGSKAALTALTQAERGERIPPCWGQADRQCSRLAKLRQTRISRVRILGVRQDGSGALGRFSLLIGFGLEADRWTGQGETRRAVAAEAVPGVCWAGCAAPRDSGAVSAQRALVMCLAT